MKVATFDIEAFNWTQFRILGFFDGQNYQEHYSVASFLDEALSKKYRSYRIYAHFAGRYDFLFLLEDLLDRDGLDVSIIEAGSRIIQLIVKQGKNTWYFLDSFALLPAKLSDLCDAFGVKHSKLEIDHTKDEYLTPKGRRYLMNDCLGLYEVLEKFCVWGQNDGKLKMTAASQAMYIFRNNFLDEPLYRLNREVEDFIRQCYYGGRCEIFRAYGKDLNYYDVNSMYPFVMMGDFPIGQAVRTRHYVADKIGFYKIRVTIPDSVRFPYIPYVDDGKLLFPIGTFNAYVTSAEIAELIKDGHAFKILEGWVFMEKKPIFRDYVRYFYDIKQKAEKGSAESFIAKLALNSLYGKTGQKRVKETIIKVTDYDRILKERLRPYYEQLGLYKKETESKSHFIQPQLAAYVTSLARMELYRLIKEAGAGICYCDTDSIITDRALPVGKGLGELKKEYSIKEAVFLQPKLYCMDTDQGRVLRMKGFSKQDIGIDLFKKVLRTGNLKLISADVPRMEGWKESLGRHGRVMPSRIIQKKELQTKYNKRHLLNNYETLPLKINN